MIEPIRAVAEPIKQIGVCPARWQCIKKMSASRFPMCRLEAVGSKPQ